MLSDQTDDSAELVVSYQLDLDLTIDPSALIVAVQYILAERQDRQPAGEDPKATAKQFKKDAAAITRAQAALLRGYAINRDGSLTITGSSGTSYTVGSNGVCKVAGGNTLCNGWKAAQKTHSSCYHVWAMEILLTAQALELTYA